MRTIAFSSFPGTHTPLLLEVASSLSRRGRTVLILDLRLNSPLLTMRAHPSPERGFLDLVEDAVARGERADLFGDPKELVRQYVCGEMPLFPAGRVENYINLLDASPLSDLYREGMGQKIVLLLKKALIDSAIFDVLLVDTDGGFSDSTGIGTRDLADHVVLEVPDEVSLEGTIAQIRTIRQVLPTKPLHVVGSIGGVRFDPFGVERVGDDLEGMIDRILSSEEPGGLS